MPEPVGDLDTRIALVAEWANADSTRLPFVLEAWRVGVLQGASWAIAAATLTPLPSDPFTPTP